MPLRLRTIAASVSAATAVARHFTVPDVSDGDYSVGVDMTPFGCFGSGTLTVDANISDTAFRHGSSVGGWLAIAAFLLACAAVPLRSRHRAPRRFG